MQHRSSITYRSVGNQSTREMFRMVVYLVFRCPIRERTDIRIVAVCQDSASLLLEGLWKEVLRPEVILSSPCLMRVSVQAMHKHYAVERSARFLCSCFQAVCILD